MGPQVRVMVEQGNQKRRLGVRRRSGRSNVVHFETTAAPVVATAQPSWLDRKPLLEVSQSEDRSPLSPGEKRSSTLYHQWSTGDVLVSGLLALVSGALVGLSGLAICMALKTKWYWPVIIWLGSTTIVWILKSLDFFIDRKAICSEQKQERRAEPAPIIQEAPSAEVVINTGKTQKRAKLWAPRSNHAGLWQYADSLVRGTAEPSLDGGKHVNGARSFGYTPAEFDKGPGTWRPTAIAGGILEVDPHKSKGYRVTESGKRALVVIVKRRLGEWG